MDDDAVKEPYAAQLELAKQRLAQAVLTLPLNPQGAAISGFINSVLVTARIDALEAFMLEKPANATWTPRQRLDAQTLRALGAAEQRIRAQVAAAPRIAVPGAPAAAPLATN